MVYDVAVTPSDVKISKQSEHTHSTRNTKSIKIGREEMLFDVGDGLISSLGSGGVIRKPNKNMAVAVHDDQVCIQWWDNKGLARNIAYQIDNHEFVGRGHNTIDVSNKEDEDDGLLKL